ncbi:hypothetical protein ABIB28_002799 [Sphingomonas sp. UYEF23]
MRKFRKTFLDIVDTPCPDNRVRRGIVRSPEAGFIDPMAFLHHPFGETEGVEHFHRATRDAVGLAAQQPSGFLLDDAGGDVGKSGKLRGQRQSRRSATDDQDIDIRRHFACGTFRIFAFVRIVEFRIARLIPIQVKLHDPASFSQTCIIPTLSEYRRK